MNHKRMQTAAVAAALAVLAAVALSQTQPSRNSNLPEVQKPVSARLAEIQKAAEALDLQPPWMMAER